MKRTGNITIRQTHASYLFAFPPKRVHDLDDVNGIRSMLRQKSETYRGYQIAAAPGTHQAIVDLVVDHVPRDAQLLDLGSYKGAMLRRLRDAGYRNLAGADLVNRLTDEPASFFQCDFNDAFAQSFGGNKYACIIASEVIEHVDDPRHFLKQCRALLKPEGVIIVSTPNIAFFEGRIKFFLTGELWGFGRKNYLGQRHITPISTEQFPIIFAECGYTLVSMTTAGSFATGFRKLITSPLWLCMRAAFGKFTLGETLVCMAKYSADTIDSASSVALWGQK